MPEEKNQTEKPENGEKKKDTLPPEPIVTRHTLVVDGETLNYTATTGMMPLKNDKGEHTANIFYTAYTLDGNHDKADRPLTIVFNGGPGSSSVWLHMGAVGPKRVKMQDEGWLPPPPYRLEDNPYTWLDRTDMVFVDPVGTGFSRAVGEGKDKDFWSLQGDIESVAEFIRLYLTRNSRWTSPLFLAGESYGTTRAAGLAGHLTTMGVGLNGIVLISTILNFQTARFTRGNDLPYIVFLPTYAATAWYHGQLKPELQAQALPDLMEQVEAFAQGEYARALMLGDALSAEQRETIIEKLMAYTGLDRAYIEGSKLRIQIMRFCKELLRSQNLSVGRLDSRFKGFEDIAVTEYPEFDPSYTAIMGPYTATFNQYVRETLGYESDERYEILSFQVNRGWEFDRGQFPDTSDALRTAMHRNPYLKVLVAQGYYDLATPHFAAEYTMQHMGLNPELHENILYSYYEAGHMFYLDRRSHQQLKADALALIDAALDHD